TATTSLRRPRAPKTNNASLAEWPASGLAFNEMTSPPAAYELLHPGKPLACKADHPQDRPDPLTPLRGAIGPKLRFVGRAHRNIFRVRARKLQKFHSSRSDKPRSGLCQSKNATYENFLLLFSHSPRATYFFLVSNNMFP